MFDIKDSGERMQFKSGMVRDTGAGKLRYNRVLDGPMFKRWAAHLQKGAIKYPDAEIGVPNWTLAEGTEEELQRAKESAMGHFIDWFEGKTDEDHAAALFFNVNLAEYIKDKMKLNVSPTHLRQQMIDSGKERAEKLFKKETA